MVWNYQTSGDKSNRPVLFLHGFLGFESDWQTIVSLLSDDYYCITADLPGHGQTPLRNLSQFEQVADGVINLLDHLQIVTCSLVGYSMGGRIALYTLLEHQDRFDGAVIESANPGIESVTERLQRAIDDDQLATDLEEHGLQQFVDRWYQMPLFASLREHEEQLAVVKATRMNHNTKRLARALRVFTVGRQADLWPRLSEIDLPIMFLAGENDHKYRAITERAAHLIPQGTFVSIDNAGHNVHLEAAEQFIDCLKEFMARVHSTPVGAEKTGGINNE